MRRAVLTRSTARADRRNAIAVPQWSGIFTRRKPVVLPEFAIAILTRRRTAVRENSNDAVFPTRNGTWHQVNNVERRWRQIRTDTGLEWITPHTFRKTVATLISPRVDAGTGQTAAAPHKQEEPTAGHHVVTADEARSMTDAELCQAWRRSFVTLMSTDSLGRRAGVVSLRQAILDEIEVRHPAGLRAWLDSGARPAGGPDRFLGRGDEVGPCKPPGRAPGIA